MHLYLVFVITLIQGPVALDAPKGLFRYTIAELALLLALLPNQQDVTMASIPG